ncbi:hypothetical protein GDO78_015718 [Eleutherodactylus coqui]|uniref:Uncharacterized protein n=1 Tax=Eleutherodactylus coqui TaxID=57060 RepID=A0A8J6JNT9_ELECQ|nr:hypothetical protein GDO78_015718 [Eleutherodactylus coqui]
MSHAFTFTRRVKGFQKEFYVRFIPPTQTTEYIMHIMRSMQLFPTTHPPTEDPAKTAATLSTSHRRSGVFCHVNPFSAGRICRNFNRAKFTLYSATFLCCHSQSQGASPSPAPLRLALKGLYFTFCLSNFTAFIFFYSVSCIF